MTVIIDLVEHHKHDSSANNPVKDERCGDGTSQRSRNGGSTQIPLAETASLNTAAAKQDQQPANERTCSLSEVDRRFRKQCLRFKRPRAIVQHLSVTSHHQAAYFSYIVHVTARVRTVVCFMCCRVRTCQRSCSFPTDDYLQTTTQCFCPEIGNISLKTHRLQLIQ